MNIVITLMISANERGSVRSWGILFIFGVVIGAAVVSAGQLAAIANGDVDVSVDNTEDRDPKESTSSEDQRINEKKIEMEIHERVNDFRVSNSRSRLLYEERLSKIADYHSENMAEKGFFSHTSPSGHSFEHRYNIHGYDCKVQTPSGGYAVGGENIAYTYAYSNIDKGSEIVNYNGNETKIAAGIVKQWLNSEEHRSNILRTYWKHEGIGVSVSKSGGRVKVYATQNFC